MVIFRGIHYYMIVRNRDNTGTSSFNGVGGGNNNNEWKKLDDERTSYYKDWKEVLQNCLYFKDVPTVLIFNQVLEGEEENQKVVLNLQQVE